MPDQKKLTVMCYFGSDNALAPLLISQLKALKEGGYEANTNVIARFDPHEPSARTRLYDVNAKRRDLAIAEGDPDFLIGDEENPYVRNMAEDIITPATIAPEGASANMRAELVNNTELPAIDSLENFVGYCTEAYPAEHYMLFLIGHGMIVGNDAFLPDNHPISGISLSQLSETLSRYFKDAEGKLELLGLHSCSMSSVELAYELQGVANYMIASQGTSYVGSWPYRQILKKVFGTVHDHPELGRDEVRRLVEKIYLLSLYNSTDFIMAGYSSDLALCNLQDKAVNRLTGSLEKLTCLMIDALGMPATNGKGSAGGRNGRRTPIKELIVSLIGRAHAESQSYWGESYTDLYDFCDCLCQTASSINEGRPHGDLKALIGACQSVIEDLKPKTGGGKPRLSDDDRRRRRFDRLVVRSEHFGWKYQHSHGLSIYFPWSEPLDCENADATPVAPMPRSTVNMDGTIRESIMERYKVNKFSTAFKNGPSWFDFLNAYFEGTQRRLRTPAPAKEILQLVGLDRPEFDTLKVAAAASGALDHKAMGEVGPGDNKPTASTGIDGCSVIKNFPTQPGRDGRKIRAFSISAGALKAFQEPAPAPRTRKRAPRKVARVAVKAGARLKAKGKLTPRVGRPKIGATGTKQPARRATKPERPGGLETNKPLNRKAEEKAD